MKEQNNRLLIKRGPSENHGTFGEASFSDGTSYTALEPPWRDNSHGYSSIPVGIYRAYAHTSPHFGVNTYYLLHVPGRTNVELLPGVWAGDVHRGLYNDMLGQIALGWGAGELAPPEPGFAPQKALLNSRAAMADFMRRTGSVGIYIEIEIVGFDSPGIHEK